MRLFTRGVGIALVALFMLASVASADASDNPNSTEYWLARYPNAVACYKYEGTQTDNAHGRVTQEGKAFALNVFQEEWPGDRWEVLVVKGGSEEGNTGLSGMNVYDLPAANVDYFPPLNGGGNQPDISHVIVCKGQTPEGTPTPSPSETPSPSASPSESPSASPSESPQESPSATPSESATPSATPSASVTPAATPVAPDLPNTAAGREGSLTFPILFALFATIAGLVLTVHALARRR